MVLGIFAILDDLTLLVDNIAASTNITTQKTVGILGDDLAVNAEKETVFALHSN